MTRRPKPGSVRNVVTGRSDGYTGRVPFARLGQKTVAYGSLLEGDFLLLTSAFEADISNIDSQPFWLDIHGDTTQKKWLPDYHIERASGTHELVEVKPIEQVRPDRSRFAPNDAAELHEAVRKADNRFRALQAAANENGFKFRLITEDEIRIEPRLGNAALLLRYARPIFPMAWIIEARIALATMSITNVAELQAALPQSDAFAIALHLAWMGEIEFDPTSHFSRESRFLRVGQRLLDPSLSGSNQGGVLNG